MRGQIPFAYVRAHSALGGCVNDDDAMHANLLSKKNKEKEIIRKRRWPVFLLFSQSIRLMNDYLF